MPASRRFFLLLIGCCALPLCGAAENQACDFSFRRERGEFAIAASGTVRAPANYAWDALTDYNHLHDFIPNMVRSRVTGRGTDEGRPYVDVEQTGQVTFWPFSTSFSVALRVFERPTSHLEIQLVSGDMENFTASYDLTETAGCSTIRYTARFRPSRFVPPLLGTSVLRSLARRQFEALLRQIENAAPPRS